jgi:hypothetical protein
MKRAKIKSKAGWKPAKCAAYEHQFVVVAPSVCGNLSGMTVPRKVRALFNTCCRRSFEVPARVTEGLRVIRDWLSS